MTDMNIRPLTRTDYDQWLPLWQENCEQRIHDDVTAETWRRICHPREQVFGLCAEQDGRIEAILHYVLHPTTGQVEPVCYMQDLFVAPGARRQGIARRLLWELQETGKNQGWARVYWVVAAENAAAQALYKTLAVKMDFALYINPLCKQDNTLEGHFSAAG